MPWLSPESRARIWPVPAPCGNPTPDIALISIASYSRVCRHFTTPIWADGLLPLSSLARVAAVCQMNPEHDLDTVRDFLHEFCAQWKPLSFRGREREFGRWSGNSETSFSTPCAAFPSQPTIQLTSYLTSVAIANLVNSRPSQARRASPLRSAACPFCAAGHLPGIRPPSSSWCWATSKT